jgi:DNA-binding NtrC family response regulator
MTRPVLVIDDDPVQRRLIQAALARFGYEPLMADGGEAGLALLDGGEAQQPAAVILDLVMPGMDGIEVLERMREKGVETPVIVQTAQGGVETAVRAMRAGAFDFVVKPVAPEKLRTVVENAIRVAAAGGEARKARGRSAAAPGFRDIVSGSGAMERVLNIAAKAADSAIPVLIEGESGVGKELVARAIQAAGRRRGKPFVTVNCGAIPDNLVESILFGHEKGAFTGATEKHAGKFVEANGGTLFLDEIGDLPASVQVKLLRAVQDGEIDPVGARSTVKVDIRLISASHRDLLQRVKDGLFREDLFYRLNVFPIHVPPLRDRREDIPELVRHFIAKSGAAEGGRRIAGITGEALALLKAYDWPGNIRQLENAVLRASVLCEGDVLGTDDFPQIRAQVSGIVIEDAAIPAPAGDLPSEPRALPPQVPAGASVRAIDERGEVRALADIEEEMIRLAIDHYNGQMSEVARRLGIGRSTLYRKLKDMGIDPDQPRADRLAS